MKKFEHFCVICKNWWIDEAEDNIEDDVSQCEKCGTLDISNVEAVDD